MSKNRYLTGISPSKQNAYTLNSFFKIPRSIFFFFQTTIFIRASFRFQVSM